MLDQSSWPPFGVLTTLCYLYYNKKGRYPSCVDCTTKKTPGFYVRVLIDVDMFSSLSQQLLVVHSGFAFATNMEYERLLPFRSFRKMIGHMLYACTHHPQSDKI